MLEASVERLIFAPAERIWRELGPDRIGTWSGVRVEGTDGAAFAAGAAVRLRLPALVGSRSHAAHVTAVEAGRKLVLKVDGGRADEIEWTLHPKNNSTRVLWKRRFVPQGPLAPFAKQLVLPALRRRCLRALLALEARTTGEEAAPLTPASAAR